MSLTELLLTSAPFLVLAAVLIVAAISLYIAWLGRRTTARATQFATGEVLLTEKDVNLAEHLSSANRTRGNGVLVLTREELGFQGWDGTSVRVPLTSIQRVEQVQVTVGGKPARPLLRVYYHNSAGEQDVAAWLVAGAPEWVRQIEQLST